MRPLRLLVILLLAGLLLAPGAQAQTLASPLQGGFTELYVVTGRILDEAGFGAAGATLTLELDQEGVTAKPLHATANCYGDFITSFTLKQVDPRGKVRISVDNLEGRPAARAEAALDPFYRRSDLKATLEGEWGQACPPPAGHPWNATVSVSGRIVNRTEPYEENGAQHQAIPWTGYVRIRFVADTGEVFCPPSQNEGLCDPIFVDERGDFRYTWTFADSVDPRGRVEVTTGKKTWNITVDPVFRLASSRIEYSGAGEPGRDTPTVPPALVFLALATLSLARRRR